jgi:hypothetical protein
VSDSETTSMLGITCATVVPTPGITMDVVIRGATAEASVQWQPTESQEGVHIVCFVASDRCQAKSPPTCLVVVVTRGFEEVR